jgi:hypothetical protein
MISGNFLFSGVVFSISFSAKRKNQMEFNYMQRIIKILFLLLLAWSCDEEPVETVFSDLDTRDGVFIACEGNFMYGNGSLSFYNSERKIVTNQIFHASNNAPLGDVVQSLEIFNNTLFIVVNNSGKIYTVNPETIEFENIITGLTSPRYIHFISASKAYVSDLYANYIIVINPATLEVTGKIDLGEHTSEQMVQVSNRIFVSCWSYDEYLLVIDTETDELVTKIKVPFQPKDLETDKDGKIWVLSDGGNAWENADSGHPALSRIDPLTCTIEQIYRFDEDSYPSELDINNSGDTIYYLNGDVFKMGTDSRDLPGPSFIKADNRNLYGIAVNPDNNEIYIADAMDYSQSAIIYRYSRSGELIDTFLAGINPSDFLFR